MSTVVVEPGCTATVSPFGDVAIDVGDVAGGEGGGDGGNSSGGRKRVKRELDPVYLSIFAHRFMGIAEQMGRTLQVLCFFFAKVGVFVFQSLLRSWGLLRPCGQPILAKAASTYDCCRHRCAAPRAACLQFYPSRHGKQGGARCLCVCFPYLISLPDLWYVGFPPLRFCLWWWLCDGWWSFWTVLSTAFATKNCRSCLSQRLSSLSLDMYVSPSHHRHSSAPPSA